MADYIGIERKARRAYGFDEIALVPGSVTIDPDDVDTSWELGGIKFPVPFRPRWQTRVLHGSGGNQQ